MIYREIITVLKSNLSSAERRSILLASLGSLYEYYDFVIFGFMTIYFATNCIPDYFNGKFKICIVLALFLGGYLFRPLGMYCYSKIYYLYPRIYIINWLIAGLLVTANLIMVVLVAHKTWSTFLFLILSRSIQGFARGAEAQSEFGFLSVVLGEKRGISAFGLMAGAEIGVFFALVVNSILNHTLDSQQMYEFGWRLPFAIGGVFSIIIYLLRYFMHQKRTSNQIPHMSKMLPSWMICVIYPWQMLFTSLLSGLRACLGWFLVFIVPLFFLKSFNFNYLYIGHLLLFSSVGSIISSFLVFRYVTLEYSRIILPYLILITVPVLVFFIYTLWFNFLLQLSLLFIGIISGALAVLNMQVSFSIYSPLVRLSTISVSYNIGHTLVSGFFLLIISSLSAFLEYSYSGWQHFEWWLLYLASGILILMSLVLFYLAIKLRKLKYYPELLHFIHNQRK